MANQVQEGPGPVKEENEQNAPEQPPNRPEQHPSGGKPNFGGGPRRGGPNKFGNRRQGQGQFNNQNQQQQQHQHQHQQNNRGPGGSNDGGNFRRRGPQGGGPRGYIGGHDGNFMQRDPNDKLNDKLSSLQGPSYDLPPLPLEEKKFSGRTRLYVGNLPSETEESDLVELFSPYGETSEFFINKEKNFAFVRVDYRVNAERAKRALDGTSFKGKSMKIRFAPNGSTIKVKNIPNFVTNELLYYSFQIFGEIERAFVMVDERGRPMGEGIVEFARKGCALHAVRKCGESCFFLTASLRPCIVEMYEPGDDFDGYPEKSLPKKNPEFLKVREVGPRFANTDSFEHEYGMRWKQLHDLYQQKEMALKKEYEIEQEKLEAQMEYARYEHETEMLRNQLREREMDRDRQKHEWEMKERLAEEQRQRTEEQMRRQQEEMQQRIVHQEEDMRRRQQENNLFMQAHQLDSMLNQQEQAYDQPNNNFDVKGDAPGNVVEPKAFMNSFKRNRFEGRGDMGISGPRNGGGGGGRGHWVNNDNRRDDFQAKRRRF